MFLDEPGRQIQTPDGLGLGFGHNLPVQGKGMVAEGDREGGEKQRPISEPYFFCEGQRSHGALLGLIVRIYFDRAVTERYGTQKILFECNGNDNSMNKGTA